MKKRALSKKLKPWHLIALAVVAIGYLMLQYHLYTKASEKQMNTKTMQESSS